MTASWNNEKIKLFVKDTLGCACPEKVFEKIDVNNLQALEHEKEMTRIVVGETLLIYVICPELSGDFVESVKSIGLAGKTDRDTNHYNRFRLVVSGFDDELQQGKAAWRFSNAFNTDEKMHIHFVAQELVDGLS
jgi:hypothetical protein